MKKVYLIVDADEVALTRALCYSINEVSQWLGVSKGYASRMINNAAPHKGFKVERLNLDEKND